MATFTSNGTPITEPSPQYDIPLVCNNGVLKARHQSGLPLGYTLLDYIESSGTQHIDTGVVGDNTTGFYIDAQKTVNNNSDSMVFGSRLNNSDTRLSLDVDHSGTAIGNLLFGWDTITPTGERYIAGLNRFNAKLNYMNDRKGIINGQEYSGYTQQLTETATDQSPLTLGAFSANLRGSYAHPYGWRGRIWSFQITQGTSLVRNFVPVKRSDNVVGMYDLVSGQFFTNAGTGDFTAGDPVSDPVEIYTDGTVETINVHGKNLFDKTTYIAGKYYNSSGNIVENPNYGMSDFIPMKSGQTFALSGRTPSGIALFNTSQVWQQQVIGQSFTAPYDGYFVVSLAAGEQDTLQVERGSTATDYVPYFDGGTATCEDLLSVGTYTDEQEVISGAVTRNVGVKVLDGTENWILSGGTGVWANFQSITGVTFGTTSAVCTHSAYAGADVSVANMNQNEFSLFANGNIAFKNANTTSTSDWTTFLSTQYAAGTPVIVVYPLATATTETVTGQPMSTTQGDNTVEITQASMSGLELEATYNAGVVLTVEEVEDAQLSPDVEVTIQ